MRTFKSIGVTLFAIALFAIEKPAGAADLGSELHASIWGRLNGGSRTDWLTSPNGRYKFVMQGDCNLVLYDGSTPMWASRTVVGGADTCFVEMSADGYVRLAVYSIICNAENPIDCHGPELFVWWWVGAPGYPGAFLRVQDDGNVVLYAPQGWPIWSTRGGYARPR